MTTTSFVRDGLRYTITDVKARRAVWVEADHPRDRVGRFIETGAEVRMWGGIGGTVVRNVGGGRIEVERSDGQHVIVHRNYLTVTKRPDGTAPTAQRSDAVGELRQSEASADAVEAPEPIQAADVDPLTPGEGIDDLLTERDPALAERVRSAASDYQEALLNNTPDDEADERATLIDALDQVDALHGDDPQVREQSQLLRQAAVAEPAEDAPAVPGSQRPAPRPRDEDDVEGGEPPTGAAVPEGAADAPEGTTEAPDAQPQPGVVYFTGEDGSDAWLAMEDGTPVGYLREPDGTTHRFDQSADWASTVDRRGMQEGRARTETEGEADTAAGEWRDGDIIEDENGRQYHVYMAQAGSRIWLSNIDADPIRARESVRSVRVMRDGTARYDRGAEPLRRVQRADASPDATEPPEPTGAPTPPDRTAPVQSEAQPVERFTSNGQEFVRYDDGSMTAGGRGINRETYDLARSMSRPEQVAPDSPDVAGVALGDPERVSSRDVAVGDRVSYQGQIGTISSATGGIAFTPDDGGRRQIIAGAPAVTVEVRRVREGAAPEQPEQPEAPETGGGLDEARSLLRQFAIDRRGRGRGQSSAAADADTLADEADENLRVSPGGGLIARRQNGRWTPHTVGGGAPMVPPGVDFDDQQIDDVLTRLDATGIPFGDVDALVERWGDPSRRDADRDTVSGIVTDPVYRGEQPTQPDTPETPGTTPETPETPETPATPAEPEPERPSERDMSQAFRFAVYGAIPNRRGRNQTLPPAYTNLVRARDLFARGGDDAEITRILRDEDVGDSAASQNLLTLWGRYTGDTSPPESREDRVARLQQQARERANMDDRWAISGGGLYSMTLTNLRAGDVIYTQGQGTEANPVALPRAPRGGALPRTSRVPRTVDRIEGRGNTRTVHFTDGTSTGAEGGDRIGTTYSGRDRVFGVPADRRPEPGAPTPTKRPSLLVEDGATSAEVRPNMQDMFNFTAPSGWKTRLRMPRVSRSASTVRGDILNEEGRAVGVVQRTVLRNSAGELEVHHDLLSINPSFQGGGFADAYYKHLYERYGANGIDVVTINANIDVGGYAWAQRGFEWAGGEAPAFQRSRMSGNIDNVLRGVDHRGGTLAALSNLTPEQRQRIEAFKQELTDGNLTPKQVANSLSDITWTETTRGGKEITMWPGKRALLGTSWNGTYRVGTDIGERPEVARPAATTPPEPEPVPVPDTPLESMSDADLAIEAESNAVNISTWYNQRGVNHPSVEPLVRRQRDVAATRQQRVAEATRALLPDGEDVAWADLQPGDQVMAPFVTEDGPQVVEVVAVDTNYQTVRVRLDDGTVRRHILLGSQRQGRWRRGRPVPPVERVRTADLAVGDRVVLDDGRTGTIAALADGNGDRVEVDVDVDGGGEVYDVDRDITWNRLNAPADGPPPPPPVPEPRDLTDEELAAEQYDLVTRMGLADPDVRQAMMGRWTALSTEARRRQEARDAAAVATPITPDPVDAPTARPRLYTYQRRNLVALGLDMPDADADLVVKQAAARVRNRMPLTAEQSQALADHLHQMADDESLGVRKQRSTTRLALAMEAATAVALGRADTAKQPGNDRVRRVRTTGLTSGDTAVIRGRDGSLQTVRVVDAKPMMRGTLARLTLEHENGRIETRIVDRDTDAWLMPDLPADKPVPPAPRTTREVTFAQDIRPGDRIAYQRHDSPERAEGVVESVADRHGDMYITVDGYEFEVRPTGLRTRLDRGAESADQPYWLTLTDEVDPPTITGSQVRVGDLIEEEVQGVRGTVVDIEEIEGEGGVRGYRFQVAETDQGQLTSLTMFDPQTATRWADAGKNATHSVEALSAEHAIRQRLGGALLGLRTMQVDQMNKTSSTILDRLGRPISGVAATRAAALDAIGRHREAVLRDIGNGSAGHGYDARHYVALALAGGYTRSPERRDEAAQVVSAAAADAFDRFAESIRTAQPLPDEDESAMVRRVLTQWRDDPPTRHNERVARSLLAANLDIEDTAQQVDVPALPEGDLVGRMDAYRSMIGGQFGHTTVRRAGFADLDFDALERGETPPVTFIEQHKRDTDPADNGPGATAMRHLDAVKAAGADLDAAIREREQVMTAARLRSSAGEFYADGDTVDTLRARMQARVDQLSNERGIAFERFKQVENDYLASHGFDSLNALNRRRMELRATIRHGVLTSEGREELARLDDLRQVVQDREHPALTVALDEFYAARTRHQDMEAQVAALATIGNTVRREAASEVLAQVREVGGERLSYQAADSTRRRDYFRNVGQGRVLGERDQNVRAMRSAEDVLPREWLARIREMVRTSHSREHIGLGSLTRGHADYRGNIRLSDSGGARFDGDNGRGRVAVHELGHFAERSVPGLLANEAAFLWSRTSTGEPGARQREQMVNMRGRGGDSSQYGFLDEFPQAYSGVDYQRSRNRSTEAYELLTTGLESLFAGSEYMDEDYRRWLLGTLALL